MQDRFRRWLGSLLSPVIADALAPLQQSLDALRADLVIAGIVPEEPQAPLQHDCGHTSASFAHSKKTGRTMCLECYAAGQ